MLAGEFAAGSRFEFSMPISPKPVAAKKQICSSSFFHGRYQRLRVLIPE
jgi:hypothetical protein